MEREYTAHSTTQLGYEIQNQTTRTVPTQCLCDTRHTSPHSPDSHRREYGCEKRRHRRSARNRFRKTPQKQQPTKPCREREDSGCSALQNQCLPLRNGHYEFRALHHETHHSEEPSETRDRSTARRENLLSALRKAPTRNNLQTPEKGQQETPQSDEALRQKSQSRASEFQNDVCQNQPRQRPARNSSCREGRQTATQQKTRGQEESQRSGRTHCRTLSHHEAQPCRHRARCPPEGTARNRQHDQKTRQTSRADERDQQRQPSCLRSDRAGHSCTQQTPSRWRCDVQLSTRY